MVLFPVTLGWEKTHQLIAFYAVTSHSYFCSFSSSLGQYLKATEPFKTLSKV